MKRNVEAIQKQVSEIKESTIRIEASLAEHMARTALNEARITSMERWTLGLLTGILMVVIGTGVSLTIKHFVP